MRYRTIVADPPWDMTRGRNVPGGPRSGSHRWHTACGRVSDLPYRTMSVAEIRALAVHGLAADDAHLYLWAPNLHLEAAYGVARVWGFNPSTVLVWAKPPRGIALGGTFTSTTEYVLFARRGSLKATKRVDTTWWNWKRPHNMHSTKPDGFLDVVEQVSPGPYLELFARRARFGWDYWGDESLGTAELAGVASDEGEPPGSPSDLP